MGRVVAWLASLWFMCAATWEIAGPFGAGHVAASTAVGIAAENMWRWDIIAPVTHYAVTQPAPTDYYCHHPWGIFWTTAAFVRVFGHHDWVCRIAPVLMSSATPPLIYATGRALWGPAAAAVATSGFVVLPIALAFANFNALEVPVIFGLMLMMWGFVRFTQTWAYRWMLVSLAGLLHALNSDWPAFVFAGLLLALLVPRLLWLNGRWYPAWDVRRALGWWLLALGVCAAVVLFYAVAFWQVGQWERLVTQAEIRAQGADTPLSEVLAARAHWIEISFTPLGVWLGKLALPVLLLRVLLLRRDAEALIVLLLAMAVVQYVVFKQGADVHIFWPHYFAPYFALALGALADTAEGLARQTSRLLRRPADLAPALALGCCLPVPLAILPDGISALRYARMTGGRFDEKGLLIHQDLDKAALMKWLRRELPADAAVGIHTSAKFSWSLAWSLGRPAPIVGQLAPGPEPGPEQLFVADARFAPAGLLTELARRYSARVVGPYWVIDPGAPARPLEGYSFERREPSALQWCFTHAHDPVLRIVPDEYRRWELRHHFGQSPNPPPTAPARSREQLRISHNLAIALGDPSRARHLRRQLARGLESSSAGKLGARIDLLGTEFEPGVAPRLIAYLRASGPSLVATRFAIESRVLRKRRLSIVPADKKDRVVGMPFAIPTRLWRPGFIYSVASEIRQRPGFECYYGHLEPPEEHPPAARSSIRLLCLP